MREKMEAMQRQITEFVTTLNNEFVFRGKPLEQPERNSLIPVISTLPSTTSGTSKKQNNKRS
jgi:hypothetical protein